jgi:excisionase family DNA binding protein
MSKLLTVVQVAEALGLKQSTIRAWISRRRIGVVHLGRSIRVPVEEVHRLIAEGTMPARVPK